MKNSEIRDRLRLLSRQERRVGKELVELLAVAMEQRAWLEFGYSSLFDWLTRGYEYSPAAAMRRIEAARLLKAVPSAAGSLGVAVMAQVQGAIRAQEKLGAVSAEKKAEAVKAVEGVSERQAQRVLVELFPAAAQKVKREVHRPVADGSIRHSMNLSEQAAADLKRAKEVLSHILPGGSDAEVVAYALAFLLKKKDPLRQPAAATSTCHDAAGSNRDDAATSACHNAAGSTCHNAAGSTCHNAASGAEPTSLVKRTARLELKCTARPGLKPTRMVMQKHQGECSYRDPKTGVKCTSRYQIQVDHIKPRALGGGNEGNNLRALCRQHNLYEAERIFGREKSAEK